MPNTFTDHPNAQFAPWLKERIEATGLSTREFSDKAGVHFVSVYSYIRGQHVPTKAIMQKLCDAAGVPLESAPKVVISRGRHKNKTAFADVIEVAAIQETQALAEQVSIDGVATPAPAVLSPSVLA